MDIKVTIYAFMTIFSWISLNVYNFGFIISCFLAFGSIGTYAFLLVAPIYDDEQERERRIYNRVTNVKVTLA